MKKINIVSFIGLGALGCAYASKLHGAAAVQFRVIASDERIRRYRNEGVMINGRRYEFNYLPPDAPCAPADLVIVAVKAYQMQQALQDIKNHVGPDTSIISLLNGISSEQEIGDYYGPEKVLFATSYGLVANRENNNVRFASYGNLAFGEKENDVFSERVMAVRELFERAGIPYSIPKNMLQSLWWKFMVNVGINQCSAVTRGRYALFQTVGVAQQLMEAAMQEVVAVAAPLGVRLGQKDIDRWYEVLQGLDPQGRTSMLEDIECGRRTEVDSFAGAVCALGKKHQIPTPVNQTLWQIIKAMEYAAASGDVPCR